MRRQLTSIATAYDRLFSQSRRVKLEHAMVYLSIAGYATHLLLVFLERNLSQPPAWIAAAGRNYFSAIYTPFSFILFYEVLMLVWALPESTTRSIAKQYEIASLIFIRGVFKDIAQMDDIGKIEHASADALPVFIDMCGGLAMFLLVAIFKMVGRRRNPYDAAQGRSPALNDFIARKKALALALTLCLVVIVCYQVGTLGLDGLRVFYTNLFTLMIFTDVLVLTLSMLVTDRYELVFRNAAFVASTIMIRASLTTDHPYNVPIALIAMAFGIITVVVYNYHSHLPAEEPVTK